MRKAFVSIFAAGILAALAATPVASAATEFGDTCIGEEPVSSPYTLTTLSAANTGLPLTAPVSGVITKVKMQIGVPLPIKLPEQVKLLRSAGGNNYTVTAQTNFEAGTGVTVVDARMPVEAGERLALHGLPFSYSGTFYPGYEVYCEGVSGDVLGAVPGDVAPGATAEFAPATQGRVPLAAVIEPDADHDGYGDETQDACPQSAALHTPCPVVVLDTSTVTGTKSVTVYVATDGEAPVTVKGVVSLGKGKKATLEAGPTTVPPGKIVRFKLQFSAKLIKRLQELPPSKKLTLSIAATSTNVAGEVFTDRAKVKLKGQG